MDMAQLDIEYHYQKWISEPFDDEIKEKYVNLEFDGERIVNIFNIGSNPVNVDIALLDAISSNTNKNELNLFSSKFSSPKQPYTNSSISYKKPSQFTVTVF